MSFDEEIPYRSIPHVGLPEVDKASSQDEGNYNTLRAVRDSLAYSLAQLDKWSAFDTLESEVKIKQQIIAHRIAYDILSPLLESIDGAIEGVDRKYRED